MYIMRTKFILLAFLIFFSSCRRIGVITYHQFHDVTVSLDGGSCTIDADDFCHMQYLIDDGTDVTYKITSEEHEITAPGIRIKVEDLEKHSQIRIDVEASSVPKSWTANFFVFVNKDYTLNIKQE